MLGSFVAGFSAGFVITLTTPEDFLMMLMKASLGGMVTALPRIAKELEEYGKFRQSKQ